VYTLLLPPLHEYTASRDWSLLWLTQQDASDTLHATGSSSYYTAYMSYSNVSKAHRVQHTKLRVTPNDDTNVFQTFPPQTTLLSETFHKPTSPLQQHATLRHDAHLSTFIRKNSAVRSAITDDVAMQGGRRGHRTVI